MELVAAEKIQPKAGRLDLLVHDEQLNRRYEIELMLGATDPSHIMRTIEYWDIERRRYPAYDHVAVLVAEDITSRFLNLISLLAGSIPIIAIQLSALHIDDKIVLHFARILDHTELRSDDEWELGDKGGGGANADRGFWQQRVPANILAMCDELVTMVSETSGVAHSMQYRKRIINVLASGDTKPRLWLAPRQKFTRFGGYVAKPEDWVKRFEQVGLVGTLKRGNKATTIALTPESLKQHKSLLIEFITDVFADDEVELV